MKTNMHRRASTHLFAFAKSMRKNPTKAERLLWERLRGKQTGYKFRRQHPMDDYVVDFYCHPLQYVIEVDGEIHNQPLNQLEDENKDIDLRAKGYCVQRFTNDEVIKNIENVMMQIHDRIRQIREGLLTIEEDE